MGAKREIGRLGGRFSEEEAEIILSDFQGTLLDFCESQLSNGSRQGEEWHCADLENSPLKPGSRGSCSVNLRKGVFNDKNPAAEPASGGMLRMWCAIFKVGKRDALAGMKKWCEDRSLPDDTTGRSSGKLRLSEDSSIQALDEYEKEMIGWIKTFQAWTAWMERGNPWLNDPPERTYWIGDQKARDLDWAVYTAEKKKLHDNLIGWAISNIYSRRWLVSVEFTQSIRDDFAAELAQLRGLSKAVFLWLIDAGQIAYVYERKELKQSNSLAAFSSEDFDLATVNVTQQVKVIEHFNLAFPVYREVTPDMFVPGWAVGRRFSPRPEDIGIPDPTVLFLGLHIPWTDRDGHKHWRYDPKGCTSEPWIIGDVAKAEAVVIGESTWDIIAYIDLHEMYHWKKPWAAIATRGASNGSKIAAEKIKKGAVVMRLLQNDAANATWVANLPPMPQARHRQIKPPEEDKDLNDWMRRVGPKAVLKVVAHQ
jgi:hypothetical protein